LLDDTLKGQLYVKKIWVLDCNEKNKDKEKSKDVLSVGVNFKESAPPTHPSALHMN
jgi:hypothetical protein